MTKELTLRLLDRIRFLNEKGMIRLSEDAVRGISGMYSEYSNQPEEASEPGRKATNEDIAKTTGECTCRYLAWKEIEKAVRGCSDIEVKRFYDELQIDNTPDVGRQIRASLEAIEAEEVRMQAELAGVRYVG